MRIVIFIFSLMISITGFSQIDLRKIDDTTKNGVLLRAKKLILEDTAQLFINPNFKDNKFELIFNKSSWEGVNSDIKKYLRDYDSLQPKERDSVERCLKKSALFEISVVNKTKRKKKRRTYYSIDVDYYGRIIRIWNEEGARKLIWKCNCPVRVET